MYRMNCENTLASLLKKGKSVLEESGIEEAGLDAWLLLEYETGKSRAFYLAHPEEEVEEKQAVEYLQLIRQRSLHIPVQQLTHQAFFMGYEFWVNEHVLIPRQDTECLVEEALRYLKGKEHPRILDMCTGSGCILASLLLELPNSTGVGVDVSCEALEVARRNLHTYGLEERAVLVQSDLFADRFFDADKEGTTELFDMIISNPPYIATAEIDRLAEEVRQHDPRIALDGKEDGLYFYRTITAQAERFLKPGGCLLYEIGYDQGETVTELMRQSGYTEVRKQKDLAGCDRVVCGRKRM